MGFLEICYCICWPLYLSPFDFGLIMLDLYWFTAEDLQSLFHGEHLDEDGALLAVTLAHLRSPQRIPVTGPGGDQWQRLRLLLGTLAQQRGLCGVPVERLELKGVATEFWIIGMPGSNRLGKALRKQLERVRGTGYKWSNDLIPNSILANEMDCRWLPSAANHVHEGMPDGCSFYGCTWPSRLNESRWKKEIYWSEVIPKITKSPCLLDAVHFLLGWLEHVISTMLVL